MKDCKNIVEFSKKYHKSVNDECFDCNGVKIEVGKRVFNIDPFWGFSKENEDGYGTVIEENAKLYIKWDLDYNTTALIDSTMLEVVY